MERGITKKRYVIFMPSNFTKQKGSKYPDGRADAIYAWDSDKEPYRMGWATSCGIL